MYGRLVNERGKLNINALVIQNKRERSEDRINQLVYNRFRQLFELLEIEDEDAQKCIDGLVDWIDGNPSVEPYGAEEDYYRSLDDNPYYARNDYLVSVDEMRLVKGCTADIVEKAGAFVTVYPRKGPFGRGVPDSRIDAALAPKVVLMAVFLAMPEDSAVSPNDYEIVSTICEEIYTKAVEKCGVTITISEEAGASVSSPSLLTGEAVTRIIDGRLEGDFDLYTFHPADAQYYHIRGLGDVNEVQAGIEAVIVKTPQSVEVLSWRED